MNKFSFLSDFRPGVLIDTVCVEDEEIASAFHISHIEQRTQIHCLQDGTFNLLICTSAMETRVDFPNCDFIIRMDRPTSYMTLSANR